jgi:hypothetical protein
MDEDSIEDICQNYFADNFIVGDDEVIMYGYVGKPIVVG